MLFCRIPFHLPTQSVKNRKENNNVIFENTRDPKGFGGRLMVTMMNLAHTPVALWGLHFLHLAPDAKVLD